MSKKFTIWSRLTGKGPRHTARPAPRSRLLLEALEDRSVPAVLGDFNGDGFAALAIGVPGESVGNPANAGAVNVLYGSRAGLTPAGNQLWTQSGTGTAASEAGDRFGAVLAAGDF